MKFSVKNFFSKGEQIRRELVICSHLLKNLLKTVLKTVISKGTPIIAASALF